MKRKTLGRKWQEDETEMQGHTEKGIERKHKEKDVIIVLSHGA